MESDLLTLYAAETKQLLWSKRGMDATRNAAVFILFAMIAVSFGLGEATGHRVPYFGSLAVFALVLFEARLFRTSVAGEHRVQLLEQNFLPSLFNQPPLQTDWRQRLAESYAHPPKPSFLEALAGRIYKNYFLIFLALDTSWLAKVYLSPAPAQSFAEFVHRLDLGFFSGWITVGFMSLFWISFTAALLKIRSAKKHKDYLNGY